MKNDCYILIVEDSYTQAKQIESILKQLGYPIAIASNAREAIDFLKKQKVIIVVADILMPEMDGYQLCKQIKTDNKFHTIPVVLLTQLSDPKEIIRGLECGADDFIVKPYNEELLLTRIQTILTLKLKQNIDTKQTNILVVEDSPTQAEQLKYLLEEHGYTATVAANGKEGLEAARKTKPTIIISDILMPVMDGYEFAYEIKHDKELQKTPIILITSLMDRKEIARKASIVADGYFTKPYDENYLLSKIESLLSTPHREKDDKKDLQGLEVAFSGEHYTITAGRRQILTFLLSTYENAVQQNHDLVLMQRELQIINEQLEEKVRERTQQLQASEESFRALAENANDGIGVCVGSNGTIVYANKRMAEITGCGVDERINACFAKYIHLDKSADAIEKYKQLLEGTLPLKQFEISLTQKNGNVVPAEMTVAKTLWHGRPAAIVIVRDITERKKKEEEFIRASKLESLSTLAGGIAHDFNNLLVGVLGNVSIAKELANPKDKIYTILTDLEKASLMAKTLTQQLLTFAKGGTPIKKIISIDKLLRDSASFALSGSNIKCDFSAAEDLYPLEVDEGQINQVVHNLILNAVQSMPKGGIIKVSAENITVDSRSGIPVKDGKYVKITVQDTGIGIPEKNLTKIFDPYFTTKEGGSGLGLATVYSVIKNHDGYISVKSKVEAGTTLDLYFPASAKEIHPAKDAEEKLLLGKGRILVMDDEEIVRDVMGRMLVKLGYEVGFAKDGNEAIQSYKHAKDSGQPFNAVIMDLTIPGGIGGKEAAGKLLEIDSHVKVIVSSGYSEDAIMSNFRKYGFSAVIAKPYRIADLGKTVHKVLTEENN